MAASAGKIDYTQEMRDFAAWARWAERTDAKTIFHICGLSNHGSPPNLMTSIKQLKVFKKKGNKKLGESPPIYDQVTGAPLPQALEVQEFMDWLMVAHRAYHQALVAKHLRRVNGELMLYSSESRIAEMLFTGLTRSSAQAMLSGYCTRGYKHYRAWCLRQRAA